MLIALLVICLIDYFYVCLLLCLDSCFGYFQSCFNSLFVHVFNWYCYFACSLFTHLLIVHRHSCLCLCYYRNWLLLFCPDLHVALLLTGIALVCLALYRFTYLTDTFIWLMPVFIPLLSNYHYFIKLSVYVYGVRVWK